MSSLFLEFYLKVSRKSDTRWTRKGAVKMARGRFGSYWPQSLHIKNVLLSQVASLQDLKHVTLVCS